MPATQNAPPTAPRSRWPYLVIAIAVLIVFGRLAACDFTWWDDHVNIQLNPRLNPPTFASVVYYFTHFSLGLYVPVTDLVWMGIAKIAVLREADQQGVTLNPWVFHGASILVHCITSLLVFALLRNLIAAGQRTRGLFAALVAALFWSLHPVQVEPVGWISGMKDLLAGCFGMLALLRYVQRVIRLSRDTGLRPAREAQMGEAAHSPDSHTMHGPETHVTEKQVQCLRTRSAVIPDALGTVAFALALLSKPSAITIPALALVIDCLILQRSLRSAFTSTAVWWAMTIPILIVARLAQTITDSFIAPLWARPFIAGDALAFYLYKLVWPLHLGVDYGRRPDAVMHSPAFFYVWLVPAVVAIAVILWSRRYRWLAAAGLCFLIPILPVCGLASFQFQYISTTADHYLYVALLGPAIAIAFALRDSRSRFLHGCAVIVVALLGVRSMLQTPVWSNDFTLFSHAIAVNPGSYLAINNLGSAYRNAGDSDRAIQQFRRAVQINPDYLLAWLNLEYEYSGRHMYDELIPVMEKSIELRSRRPDLYPNYYKDHLNLARILIQKGRYRQAIPHLRAYLEWKHDDVEAQTLLKRASDSATQVAQPLD